MKKVFLLFAIITVILLTSCASSRRSGCPDTFGQIGYR